MDSTCAVLWLTVRVAPFGHPRITGYLLLPGAFRSLSRPSSAPDAKAFPLRSFQLDLTELCRLPVVFRRNCSHNSRFRVHLPLPAILPLPVSASALFPQSFLNSFCCLTFFPLFSFQGALPARHSTGGPEWARTTDLAIISRTL